MKAISERKLIGDKDRNGKWQFEVDNVIRWRGEPLDAEVIPVSPVEPDPSEVSPTAQYMKLAEDYIASLKEQLSVKDHQIGEHQETLREQLRLLTYAGPAMEKQNDEVELLKQELQKKDEQIEKLTQETAEKVALLMRGQTLAAEQDGQKAQAEAMAKEMLAPKPNPEAAAVAETRALEVERMLANKPKVQTAADNFDRWGDE